MIEALRTRTYITAIILGLLISIGAIAVLPSEASASIQSNLTGGSCLNISGASCAGASTGDTTIQNTIRTIVNIFSVIVGVVAVIMIIVGGFKYITSGGDSNNISSAKNTILYAIVGLVIVGLAQAIVWFVLAEV